jgi:hypothetical protein|tara:strand:- start:2602 stop:3156 length:555 start_codon:yes stop_codon:yes gene_type:complete
LRNIPILSPRGGEEHRGYFLVPAGAVDIKGHTNRSLTYSNAVHENVRKWVLWKTEQGLEMIGQPTVHVPVPSPTTSPESDPVDGDDLRVYVTAKFRRTTPLYGSNDDLHSLHADADRYGVDTNAPLKSSNNLPATKPHLTANAARNPLREAEKRRAGLGLRREVSVKRDEDGDLVAGESTVEPK